MTSRVLSIRGIGGTPQNMERVQDVILKRMASCTLFRCLQKIGQHKTVSVILYYNQRKRTGKSVWYKTQWTENKAGDQYGTEPTGRKSAALKYGHIGFRSVPFFIVKSVLRI